MNLFIKIKKTIVPILILLLIFSQSFYIITPLVAKAQLLSVPVTDNALDSKECGPVSFIGVCMPALTLDAVGVAVAKLLIQNITISVVDWINNDFKGSPSFVSNPEQFFIDIADQELGALIESSDLNFLCSPFQIDVRLALYFKHSPFRKKISCTFTEVVGNVQGAVENSTINGMRMKNFLDGDFSQGGWDSFVSLTQTPQNNFYGAYLEAETELGIRIGDKQILKQQELGQGKGFLSWKKCRDVPANTATIQSEDPLDSRLGDYYESGSKTNKVCEVQTPGSVISSSLENSLGSGLRQLELADEFDEIINALIANLLKKAITGGMRSLSGSGSGDKSSYFYGDGLELIKQQESKQLKDHKDATISVLNRSINTETSFYTLISSIMREASSTQAMFENVEKCYIDKIDGGRLTTVQRNVAEDRIEEVNEIIILEISPEYELINNDYFSSQNIIFKLNEMKNSASNTKSLNDLSTIIKMHDRDIVPALHNNNDITRFTTEKTRISQKFSPLKLKAEQMKTQCSQFPRN